MSPKKAVSKSESEPKPAESPAGEPVPPPEPEPEPEPEVRAEAAGEPPKKPEMEIPWARKPDTPPTVTYEKRKGRGDVRTESHPSFALLSAHKRDCRGTQLLGSPIVHGHVVSIQIKRATVYRELASDWYSPQEELIEIEVSAAQFGELITSLNMGVGVPCTLRSFNGEDVERCVQEHERLKIESDFKTSQAKIANEFREGLESVQEILKKKTLTNADKDTIRATLSKCTRFMTDQAPFILSQFNEHMQKTVEAASAEFAAKVMAMAHAAGVGETFAQLVPHESGPLALEYKRPDDVTDAEVTGIKKG